MRNRLIVVFFVRFVLHGATFPRAKEGEVPAFPWAGDRELTLSLEEIRDRFDLPALAGAFVATDAAMGEP